MKKLLLATAAMLGIFAARAQMPAAFDGSWRGAIAVGGHTLPIIFNIAGTAATADSPEQLALGIPLEPAEYGDGTVTLRSETLQMTFTGAKLNDNCITGLFEQRGLRVPLTLRRCEPLIGNRPQEPQPPYPYRVEDAEFTAGDGTVIHGTITAPDDGERHPAAVLVTGSGTQNRDEELFGHKPFKLIADRLTRRGIVVLRYDDREFATGRYDGATTADYAEDARLAVEYLRRRPEVDPARVGVIGHSEGGTIAFMCAAADPSLDYIVSMAGMTVSGTECILDQNRRLLADNGADAATTEAVCRLLRTIFGDMAEMGVERIRSEAEATVARAIAADAEPQRLEPLRGMIVETLATMNEWTAYFIALDPAQYIARTQCRVLAMNGDRDVQVAADSNLGRLGEFPNLEGRLTIRRFEGLNHMFQHCTSGSVGEYAMLTETFAEEALEMMTEWILDDGR